MKNLADIERKRIYCHRMNIEQAKSIPLEELLRRLGYTPSRKGRDQLWYQSPLRSESTPSFKVNTARNAWYDFGTGEGGDIIDLIKKLDGLNTVSTALARIEDHMGSSGLPIHVRPMKEIAEPSRAMELTRIGPVHAKSLLAYLQTRGIDPKVVAPFIQEAYYRRDDDSYFALAFANDFGGFELRSPHFKGTLGSKGISTIAGDSNKVLVFEGFFDFLTSVMMNDGLPNGTIIVLNSVSLRAKAINAIRDMKTRSVELYRDRDSAGKQLLDYFRIELPDLEIVDRSDLYEGYEDLNDWFSSVGKSKTIQYRRNL